MATILRAFDNLGKKYDLDVFNEAEFLLDISAIESGDIGKVFGITSQTFALPPTNNNNAYFGNLYDLGATYPSGSLPNQNDSTPTSFTKTQPCQVISDGQAIFNGVIYLEDVVSDNQGDTLYNVVVVNETIDFKYAIQDLALVDLDWSAFDHIYNYANITNSWTNNLFGGDLVYPLVDRGYDSNDQTATEIKSGDGINTFTHPDSPLLITDFTPAIRINAVLDTIFDNIGYSYTSSFFESTEADTIYMLTTQDALRGISFVDPQAETFEAFNSSGQVVIGSYHYLADSIVSNNANSYNPAIGTFTAQKTDTYSFDFLGKSFLTNVFNPLAPKSVELQLRINGVANNALAPSRWYDLKGRQNNSFDDLTGNWNVPLNIGDEVELWIIFIGSGETLDILGGTQSSYLKMYQGGGTSIGGNAKIDNIFSKKDSVLDFLNGIIQKFNLVIEPTSGDAKTLSIEPFTNWVEDGAVVDWTDKVDRSIKWEVRHPMADKARILKFTDVEDKDSANQYSIENFDKIFGEHIEETDSDLSDGERKIGTYFAPTPMKYIEGDTTFIIPKIYTYDDGAKKRMVFKPRLMYYLGLKPNTGLSYKSTPTSSPINTGEWFLRDETLTNQTQTSHPVFHHLNALPAIEGQSTDLHFNNNNQWEYHQAEVNAKTGAKRDAYGDYWATYVNELYDVDSRLLTLNIVLKPQDIPNIRLNNKIFIDGHYYRINKISGANLTKEASTKVELLKSSPRKTKFPRRRIFKPGGGLGDTFTDIYVGDGSVEIGGGIIYKNWNDDSVFTGSIDTINQAGTRDGFSVYSGSVSWKSNRTSIPTTNRVNGINNIDERANNVVVNGSNNIIGAINNSQIVGSSNDINELVSDINIFGNNITTSGSINNTFIVNETSNPVLLNDISGSVILNPVREITAYDNNKVVQGNTKHQGSYTETYINVPVGPGTTTYLTGSNVDQAFHHHFQWTGANGNAIVYIDDALLPQYDGVQQRFTTDNSLTASKTITLTPVGGTIDGNAEETLSTPYDGLTAQIINNNWLIIQKK